MAFLVDAHVEAGFGHIGIGYLGLEGETLIESLNIKIHRVYMKYIR